MTARNILAIPVDLPVPAPPLQSLLTASEVVTPTDNRWEMGMAYRSIGCGQGSVWSTLCTGSAITTGATTASKSYDVGGPTEFLYRPFVVEVIAECTSPQIGWAELSRRARALSEAMTPYFVEYEFAGGYVDPWNIGLRGGFDVDSDPAVGAMTAPNIMDSGDPQDPLTALGKLVDYLGGAAGGGRGVIHAPARVVQAWVDGGGSIDTEGANARNLVTRVGRHLVVPGGGYDGVGPHNSANDGATTTDQFWVYATGPTVVYLSEPTLLPDTIDEALNRRTNTVEVRVERTAAVLFDTCRWASVLVNLAPIS